VGFYGFWWVLVQIRWADDRGGRSGGKSVNRAVGSRLKPTVSLATVGAVACRIVSF